MNWTAPWRLIRALTAKASLPVYDLNLAHIQSTKTKLRPFDPNKGFNRNAQCGSSELQLTGWRLAHAVKKADSLRRLPYGLTSRLGFVMEQLPTFDWRKGNLRLHSGLARAYSDFVGTGYAGRVAQGVALLSMEDRGYAFAAHYPRPTASAGPDFIVQRRAAGTKALVEAKGSFVPPDSRPNIKRILRDGLNQLSSVDPLGATKSFVVGTFLREAGDRNCEPSLSAVVDPESEYNTGQDNRSDWVLRENYAAWLDAMGLYVAASDLRSGFAREQTESIALHVVDVNNTQFGVVVLGAVLPDDWDPFFFHVPLHREYRCVVAGMSMTVLRSISHALSSSPSLLSAEVGIHENSIGAEQNDSFKGSILADGSLLGAFSLADLYGRGMQELQL